MTKTYYSLARRGNVADVDIYGDITAYPLDDRGDVSAASLSRALREMGDVDLINVHIASYGGDVKEGVAIYSVLREHPARVVTVCDSMACSIASVVFMAGDERVMSHVGELMVHNAWTWASGNAAELRKQAEDVDKINDMSVRAYMSRVSIDEDDLRALMDAETWITAEEAVEMGFATRVEAFEDVPGPSQSVMRSVMGAVGAAFPHATDVLAARRAPDGPDVGGAAGSEPGGPDGGAPAGQRALRMTERFLSAIS